MENGKRRGKGRLCDGLLRLLYGCGVVWWGEMRWSDDSWSHGDIGEVDEKKYV